MDQDYADSSSSFKNKGLITSDFKFTSANETVTAGAGTLGNTDALVDGSTTDADVLNATLTSGGAATTTIQNIETLNLTSTIAGSGLDFGSVLGAKNVSITGSATSVFTGVSSTATPEFKVSSYDKGTSITLTSLTGTTAANTAESLKVTLNGVTKNSSVTVDTVAANAGTLETLNLVSDGSAANITGLVQGANATFSTINVTGGQALTLKMAGDVVNNLKIATTNTGGTALDLDINGADLVNLGNVTGVTALTVRDSNTPGGEGFSLFNVATGSTVTLATDAGAGVFTVKGAASNTADTVNFVLKTDATTATDVNLTSVTINDVENLVITSDGAPTTGANKTNSITTLNADSLSSLTIKGASEFTTALGAIAKNITINGADATAILTIDANAVTGAATGTKTLSITGGSAADVITAATAIDINQTLTGNGGNDKFIVAAVGASTVARVTVADLAKGDIVQFGGTTVGTVTNKLGVAAGIQAQIEAAATVRAAAEIAATSTGTGVGDAATTANTAYLFSYKGEQYAFLNQDDAAEVAGGAAGSYLDNTDAIIKIVGGITGSTAAADLPTFTFA